ncbi:hypothetical protein ACLB2K_011759 [Fragaria x ananassa]
MGLRYAASFAMLDYLDDAPNCGFVTNVGLPCLGSALNKDDVMEARTMLVVAAGLFPDPKVPDSVAPVFPVIVNDAATRFQMHVNYYQEDLETGGGRSSGYYKSVEEPGG